MSVTCSEIGGWSGSWRTYNRTLRSHLRLLCSLFVSSYDFQGLRLRYSNPPQHGVSDVAEQSRVTIQLTVSQTICLGVELTPGLWPDIISRLKVSAGKLLFVSVGLPLCREVVSVICVSVCNNLSVWTLSMYISCLYTVKQCIDKIYKASFSSSSVQQIMSYQLLVAHVNHGSLDTWTVVQVIAAKFKPFIFSELGFALSSSSSSYIATDGQILIFFLLHVRRPLWREDGSVICSAITHWLESRKTRYHILLSHLRLLQSGGPGPRIFIPQEQDGPAIPSSSLFVASYDSQGYGESILTHFHTGFGKSFLPWLLAPTFALSGSSYSYFATVSRPVCLGVGAAIWGLWPDFYYCRTLRSSCWTSPSLTRGRVCNLLSKSRRTNDHILLSHLRPYVAVSYETPPTWRARSLYLHPPGTGWSSYTPGHWVPLLSSLTTRRACQSQSLLTTDGQSASLSWCLATIRVHDQVFFLRKIF
jgi:hypothetical protein